MCMFHVKPVSGTSDDVQGLSHYFRVCWAGLEQCRLPNCSQP